MDKNNATVSLFNPLSKSHIRLPFLESYHFDPLYPCKGVLSKSPPRPDEEDQHFDIALTMNPGYWRSYKVTSKISFLHVEKIGELQSLHWVCHYHIGNQILDVSSIGGRICMLHTSGSISCYNYTYSVKKAHWPSDILAGERYATAHLLESSSSELLVVICYESYYENSKKFKILSLTSSGNNKDQLIKIWNWSEIKTLDNDAIFLSGRNSVCIQAGSNVAGSIYFTDKDFKIGVFNVGKNCISHFTCQRVNVTKFLHMYQPIWLHPSYDKMLKFSNIS